jgi:hypothetical protein
MSAGRVRRIRELRHSVLSIAVLAYALALGASPLLHHDLACELKSRTHCTTCVAGISAPGLASAPELHVQDLPRAGTVAPICDVPAAVPSVSSIQDRAPPSA